MLKRKTLKVLVIPLGLVSVAALAVHEFWDWDGLLINLSTEILGIVITVAYVDWIIEKHDRDRWAGTQQRVSRILRTFANSAISGLRGPFRIHFSEIDCYIKSELDAGLSDAALIEDRLSRFSAEQLEPRLAGHIGLLDREDWKRFAAHLQSVSRNAGLIHDRYSWQLGPGQVELLLDVQSHADRALFMWNVFPELAGAPFDELPVTSHTPAIEIQAFGLNLAAEETVNMLAAVRALREA